MTIFQDFNRHESLRRGIDPAVSEAAWNTEGGLTEAAKLGDFSGPPWYTGKSWWAAQLHYGGEGYESFGNTAGMGNSFTTKTGWQPGDPRAWRDALRYALDRVKASGWGPWYGPATIGITGMRGVDPNFYWAGTPAHEWDYMTGAIPPMPSLSFNPDAKITPQPDDFSCAIRSAQWLLRSIGRNPGDNWITQHLLDEGIVTREHGLMDASGQQFADWLNREYGAEMGFTAHAVPVTFDDVAAGAGINPTMMGGRRWNHWSGVRSMNGDGSLHLANPADGWQGIGQSMTRTQFDALGPFTAIYIDRTASVPTVPEPPIVLPDTRVPRIRELLRQALAVAEEAYP